MKNTKLFVVTKVMGVVGLGLTILADSLSKYVDTFGVVGQAIFALSGVLAMIDGFRNQEKQKIWLGLAIIITGILAGFLKY